MTQPEVEEGTRPLFVPHHLLLPVLLRGIQLALLSPAPACPVGAIPGALTDQEKPSRGFAVAQSYPPVSGLQLE